jgi:protein-S-isoprenylcysteine O-methyltransferase Ste14
MRIKSHPRGGKVPTSFKVFTIGIMAILIQLGLAVAGWGGWSAFFAHPARGALAGLTVGLALLSMFAGGSGFSKSEREDRSNRWVVGAVNVIALLTAYFSAYSDRVGFWTLGDGTMRWVGVVVCAAGGMLRIVPIYVLGRRFSPLVAIQAEHKLETHGVYGMIRNPSYLGLLVILIGWALAFRSGVGLILSAALLVPIVARIRSEERLLREHFGREYDAYCARTWRLVPGIY